MRFATVKSLVATAVLEWIDDRATSRGAAIAFYTAFSMAPLLLLVIALAGLFFGQEAAQGAVLNEFRGMMGDDAALALERMISSANQPGKGIAATAISAVLLVIGATSVFAELQDSLNQIWKAPPLKVSTAWSWFRVRVLSLSLVGATGFLLGVSLILSTALTAIGGWITNGLPQVAIVLEGVNLVVSIGLTVVFFAAIYKILPDVPLRWPDVWLGAAVTAVLFHVGKYAISIYVTASDLTSSFGAAGALIVILVWVFYSTQIFLLGAEFTKVYARHHEPRSPVGRRKKV